MNESVTTTPETPASRTKFTRHGITIERRSARVGAKFATRIKFQNKTHSITLCDTVEESFKAAIIARREIHAGRWTEFREKTGLRTAERFSTLEDIELAYLGPENHEGKRAGGFPGGDKGIAPQTKQRNFQALRRLLKSAGIEAANPCSSILTQKLIADWKWSRREASAALTDLDAQIRILRSAQSELVQARSVFSPDALSFYRERAKLKLPESIAKFVAEPGIKGAKKEEYHPADDRLIARTFAKFDEFKSGGEAQQNMYKAFWLAIGFGHRASEIKRARKSDFKQTDGDIVFQPDWRPKNKKIEEIGVQNDAWPRLEPLLQTLKADDYILTGCKTERETDVFKRISDAFKTLGWQTSHHIHEIRAWAGCQVAMYHVDRLAAAQRFLRHSHLNTTQNFYGHYLKIRRDKVALRIPEMPKEFVPQIVQQVAS